MYFYFSNQIIILIPEVSILAVFKFILLCYVRDVIIFILCFSNTIMFTHLDGNNTNWGGFTRQALQSLYIKMSLL